MAFNEKLAHRVHKALAGHRGLTEKKMFGGIAFLLEGKMCCGVLNDDLVVRVGADRYQEAIGRPHARPMDFTGRSLKGFVFVGPEGHRSGRKFRKWVEEAVAFASSLPRKRVARAPTRHEKFPRRRI